MGRSGQGLGGGGGDQERLFPHWSELLLDAAQVRVAKQRAAKAGDFVEASRLKRREAQILENQAGGEHGCVYKWQGRGLETARRSGA